MKIAVLVIRRSRVAFSLIPVLLLLCQFFEGNAPAESPMLKGRVTDFKGKAVENAVVFIYQGDDIRRQPDFKSPKSDKNGRYEIALPPGRYRVAARVGSDEGIGPVPLGGKHSGEPLEIEITANRDFEQDLVVADIREVVEMGKKKKIEVYRITGRILDSDRKPVKMVYAIANRSEVFSEAPDYLSAWTDETGYYTLYLPRGKYNIGFAKLFPPDKVHLTFREMTIDGDRQDVDIIVAESLNILR